MTKRDRSSGASDGDSSNSDSSHDARSRHRHRSDKRDSSRHRKKDKKSHKHEKKVSKKVKKRKQHDEARESSSRRHDRRDKKAKKHRRDRNDSDSNDSIDRASSANRAHAAVRDLLHEFPELRTDLVALLHMLHSGGVAVISGIENRRIRTQLKALFPLLGLEKLTEPKGAFAQRKQSHARATDGDVTLLETVLRSLETSTAAQDSAQSSASAVDASAAQSPSPSLPPTVSAVVAKAPKRAAPIGPMMPPDGVVANNNNDSDDDDDDVVGPALPGMKGFRAADERVEAEMVQRALELTQAEWDRARGVGPSATDATTTPTNKPTRQEWMTVMPESSFFKDSLAPVNRPPGKAATFRTKEPAAVDLSWFDAPEERERARRAKLDIELLGYVREENAPSAASSVSRAAAGASDHHHHAASGVHESIQPAANPAADDHMRKQMEHLRASRGPSLLEQHQQRRADEAKKSGNSNANKANAHWDRDRDLTARRGMSNDDASKIIEASRSINAKFTAPTISRQFL